MSMAQLSVLHLKKHILKQIKKRLSETLMPETSKVALLEAEHLATFILEKEGKSEMLVKTVTLKAQVQVHLSEVLKDQKGRLSE